MIAAGSATRILVATKPVDFRRGAVGLAAVVAEHLGADPFICVGRDYVSASPKGASFQVDSRKRSYIRTHHLRFGLGRLRTIIAAFAS